MTELTELTELTVLNVLSVETVKTVETVETEETEDLKKYDSVTDNLKARDASASKNHIWPSDHSLKSPATFY